MLHLIHPGFVHFAVAFLILGGIVEAGGHLARKPSWVRSGGALVVTGTICLVPAVVTGFLAQNSVLVPIAAAETIALHEKVGLALLILFAGALLWKGWGGGVLPEGQRRWFALLLLFGVLLTAFGAYLGGTLVYFHGVGVGLE